MLHWLLFALSVLFLACISWPASPQAAKPAIAIPPEQQGILPPLQYDKPYDGDLIIRIVDTAEELRERCNNNNRQMLGCAFHDDKSCLIYLVNDELMRKRGWHMGLLLRHEIGHCNGWPGDHPGERSVTWPVKSVSRF